MEREFMTIDCPDCGGGGEFESGPKCLACNGRGQVEVEVFPIGCDDDLEPRSLEMSRVRAA